MLKYLLIIHLSISTIAYGALAGGRPNAFSEGQNAFAGVVNPANAVWIADRIDIGGFWVHQKVSITNKDNSPLFPPGKIDFTYNSRNIFTADAAIHKQFQIKCIDASFSLAAYTMPTYVKLRTKERIRLIGTTPISILHKTEVLSAVFAVKLSPSHSIGMAIDYLYWSHFRNGFQNSDNALRSVSPGHVTNNGRDHSGGVGLSIGWRWKITKRLNFGAAWSRKSYCGQFRRYRGYEPHHAKNYAPQTFGAGLSYKFTSKLAGRVEVLWLNLGNIPSANNNILPDGSLNLNKRGSSKSPGPGLNDATYINVGLGYAFNSLFSAGIGYSHRIKLHRSSNFISHTYMVNTIYNTLSLGANFNYEQHNVFMGWTYGFRNKVSGFMPIEIGGGEFTGQKQETSFSFSWGYLY